MGRSLRLGLGLLALAEVVVFVLVADLVGGAWTLLATLATSALGWALLARQGGRALAELRGRARENRPSGRALGDAALVAVGGLLMVLPGFLGDLLGLLCLLPPTRPLVRAALGRVLVGRLPGHLRGPVRVASRRVPGGPASGPAPRVIEGEVADPPGR